jgi:hypothetical protein
VADIFSGRYGKKRVLLARRAFALAIGVITGFLVGVLFSFPFVTAPFSWVMPDVGARSHGVGVRGGLEDGRMRERRGERRERRERRKSFYLS